MPCSPASHQVDFVDTFDFFSLECDLAKGNVSLLKGDAPAKRIRNGAWLLMDLFEHEMAMSVLTGGDRVPGNFFKGSFNGFSLPIQDPVATCFDLCDFAIFKKGDFARIFEQRRDVRGNKRLSLTAADHDRGRIFRYNEPLWILSVEKNQGVGAVNLSEAPGHCGEEIGAFSDLFINQVGHNLRVGLRFKPTAVFC